MYSATAVEYSEAKKYLLLVTIRRKLGSLMFQAYIDKSYW